jgi:CheY-like chemotaxis protein
MSGELILVVEDNELNLELVEFLLEEQGYEVRAARDAAAARTELQRQVPDLVLMDMDLPGTSGLELTAEIRSDKRLADVPVVALTAHAMRGDRERFLAGGCDDYLAKPIDASLFGQQVRELLALRGGGGSR